VDDRYFTGRRAAAELASASRRSTVYVAAKASISSCARIQTTPYWRPDIERLRKNGKSVPQATIGLKVESELTLLNVKTIFFIAVAAQLSWRSTRPFEAVAALLWNASGRANPSRVKRPVRPPLGTLDETHVATTRCGPRHGPVPVLERQIRGRTISRPWHGPNRCRRVRGATLTVAPRTRVASDHLFVARPLNRPVEDAELIRPHAGPMGRHGFEPGAFAVRAVPVRASLHGAR